MEQATAWSCHGYVVDAEDRIVAQHVQAELERGA